MSGWMSFGSMPESGGFDGTVVTAAWETTTPDWAQGKERTQLHVQMRPDSFQVKTEGGLMHEWYSGQTKRSTLGALMEHLELVCKLHLKNEGEMVGRRFRWEKKHLSFGKDRDGNDMETDLWVPTAVLPPLAPGQAPAPAAAPQYQTPDPAQAPAPAPAAWGATPVPGGNDPRSLVLAYIRTEHAREEIANYAQSVGMVFTDLNALMGELSGKGELYTGQTAGTFIYKPRA